MREPPDPERAAGPAHHGEARPDHIIAPNCNRSDAIVQPDDLAQWLRGASLRDQLAVLDPFAIRGWPPCPRCRQRSVEVADAVLAWCAACGANWTRWAVGRRILSSPSACRRIAAQILFDREVAV